MVAFVLDIGRNLEEAVFWTVVVVSVGGCLGAWRRDGVPRRSLGGLLFGEDDDHRVSERDCDCGGGQPVEPD
jgi:hypothetical protein